MELNKSIDALIIYAKNNLMLDELDETFARNKVLSILNHTTYATSNIDEEEVDELTGSAIIASIIDEAVASKLVDDENKEKCGKQLMRAVCLNPGEITDIYLNLKSKNANNADKWLNDYIKFACLDTGSSNEVMIPNRTDDEFEYVISASVTADEKYNNVYEDINNLMQYALENLELDDLDKNFVLQEVLDIIKLNSYAETEIDFELAEQERPDYILNNLAGALLDCELCNDEEIDIIIDRIMSAVSFKPSKLVYAFEDYNGINKKAMEWLYGYQVKSNYIKKSMLEKNMRFRAGYLKGGLEIAINKAKPEYANSAKAKEGTSYAGGYPACAISKDNEGYSFNEHATLRTIPLTLDGEEWFMQFSPYGYMSKHGIVASNEHKPMVIDGKAVKKMIDFVDMSPSLFVGCNAGLEGVGGSVLSHEHFQFGEEYLPLHRVVDGIKMQSTRYPLANITILDWFNSVIRVNSQSKKVLIDIFEEINSAWESYDNASLNIASKSAKGQHNCTSPIVRKFDDGSYTIDIVLRNNATSADRPLGIFHVRPEYQVIKKESIGLIESQGLFILPGRLDSQTEGLKDCLVTKQGLPIELNEFSAVYDEIIKENGTEYTKIEAGIAIKTQMGSICEKILMDTAVFKNQDDFISFFTAMGTYKRV